MVYTIFNIVFLLITLFILLISVFNKKLNYTLVNKIYSNFETFTKKYYLYIVLLLLFLTIFTSFFKLGDVPYGLHVDEAGMAYDAISISDYGVDRYLDSYPVYLTNYGGGQSSMYAYLTVIFIKLFGFSSFIIRLPAAIFRIIIFVSTFFLLKKEENKLKSTIFLLLFTVVPYFIMQSRWGLDCNLLVGFITLSIAFFVYAISSKKALLFFLSGIFFGLSLYTYALSYIILPLFLSSICIYLLYIKKIKIKHLITFAIPILLLSLPLILMIFVNNGIIDEINGFITIPKLLEYRGSEISLGNIFENLYILLSLFSFDNKSILIYNSIPYFGTIYYFTIPFFIVGLINGIKNFIKSLKLKSFNINIVFLLLFFSVLSCQLLISEPNINKSNAIFIPILYFTAVGIELIIRRFKPLLFPILFMFIISFGLFFNYYFYHYNEENNNQYFFATSYLDALNLAKNTNKTHIYIDNDLTAQEYIYILLDNSISPYNYSTNNIHTIYNNSEIIYIFGIPNEIHEDYVYIVGSKQDLLNKFTDLDFKNIQFGGITVFY